MKRKKVEVKIVFPNFIGERRKYIFKAENMLHKAGVRFDTGYDGRQREWEFDWSLRRANVILKKPAVCETCRKIIKLTE